MSYSVFIDGAAGTTGLQVHDRLQTRAELSVCVLDDGQRKDIDARADAMASADVTILCLPDDAARQAAEMAKASGSRLIDASTAHRLDPEFTYGFAELSSGQHAAIHQAQFVSNPGCYPTGFLGLVAPLRQGGLLPSSAQLSAVCVMTAPPAVSLYPSSEKTSMVGVVLRYSLTSILTVYKPGTSDGLV